MRAMSAPLVVDQTVHRDDEIESAELRIEHVAHSKGRARRRRKRFGARSRASSTRFGDTSTATTSRPAARKLDRQRARATAGVEDRARREGRREARTES